jgi:transposase
VVIGDIGKMARKPYPTDVTDEEWAFVALYLTRMREDAPQREHSLREVFNALRYVVRAGEAWRMMPNDLPPWDIVYQQTRWWIKAGVFDAMTHDLHELLRMLAGRDPKPSAAIFDSRTLQSTPESGGRGGYDGAKRKKGSKTHMVVDAPGHLLALQVTSADQQDRSRVKRLARAVQKVSGDSVALAFVD